MIVPPLPCPVRSRRGSSNRRWGLLQTARPGELERFVADDGGELRQQRPVAGLGPATRTNWLRRMRSRTVLIKPEADVGCRRNRSPLRHR
jgi:hypothetical protein